MRYCSFRSYRILLIGRKGNLQRSQIVMYYKRLVEHISLSHRIHLNVFFLCQQFVTICYAILFGFIFSLFLCLLTIIFQANHFLWWRRLFYGYSQLFMRTYTSSLLSIWFLNDPTSFLLFLHLCYLSIFLTFSLLLSLSPPSLLSSYLVCS